MTPGQIPYPPYLTDADRNALATQHENNAQEFLTDMRAILVDCMKLSEHANPDVWRRVAKLEPRLRQMFSEGAALATDKTMQRIKTDLYDMIRKL